jgi:cell division protein YceG involved in septum cleavage
MGIIISSFFNILINDKMMSDYQNEIDEIAKSLKIANQEVESKDYDEKEFIKIKVSKGESVEELVEKLYEKNIIYDKNKFKYTLELLDVYGKIPMGTKYIKKGSNSIEIINALLK